MKNAFLLLKANRIMRQDILGKRKYFFYGGIILMFIGMAMVFIGFLSGKDSSDDFGSSTVFLIQLQFFLIMIFAFDGFIILKNGMGQANQRIEDIRNYFFHLPFEFSDFIIAGLISFWQIFLLSTLVSGVYYAVSLFFEIGEKNKGLVVLASILSCVAYVFFLCAFLIGAFCKKHAWKAVNAIYVLSFVLFIAGIFLMGFFEGQIIFAEKLSSLCSPAGFLLLLSPVPLSALAVWILLKVCKKGAWYNA
jgi:hypothetical protein